MIYIYYIIGRHVMIAVISAHHYYIDLLYLWKKKKTPLSIIIRARGDLWGLLNGVS